jgi:hypothetical protein
LPGKGVTLPAETRQLGEQILRRAVDIDLIGKASGSRT